MRKLNVFGVSIFFKQYAVFKSYPKEMPLVSFKLFLFFVVAVCFAQYSTTLGYETTPAASPDTTTAAPYCDAEKCDRHGVLIWDLEQKVNDLLEGFEILKSQNEELKSDNEGLKSENEEIRAELVELQTENEALRDDVSYLQGLRLIFENYR